MRWRGASASILADDLVGGLDAVRVADGDGKAEGDFGQVMRRGVDDDGGLEAGLQPAHVTFGGGFGELVQPLGAGFQRLQGRPAGRRCGTAGRQVRGA